MTMESSARGIAKHHGRGGWPVDLTYDHREQSGCVEFTISDRGSAKDGVWKRIDPWGLAFFDKIQSEYSTQVFHLRFSVQNPKSSVKNVNMRH